MNIHDMNIKKIQRILGHRACLRVSRFLKWGILIGCALKVRITFIQNWVMVSWMTQKFYLESKASFIDISSFLITWLPEYYTFSDSSVVNLKSTRWPKYVQKGLIFYYQTFFSSNMFFIRLFLTNTWKKKNIGGHRARLREKENLFRYRA